MQFTTTVLALFGAFAASTSAQQYASPPPFESTHARHDTNTHFHRWGSNYTTPASPTGTGGAGGAGGYPGHGGNATMTTHSVPSSTDFEAPSQYGNGAAGRYVGSGLGLLVAGGVALAL